MNHISSRDPDFLKTVDNWIAEGGEILVQFCYSHAAGNRDWEFFTSFGQLQERFTQCAPRTLVTVFRKPQLPLRGVIDDDFISRAMCMVPDGEEYLATALDKVKYGKASWFHHDAGQSHKEMKGDLEEAKGTRVAFGPYPSWQEDSKDVASAVVPLADGRVECGVY